jgi:hypothetical protein
MVIFSRYARFQKGDRLTEAEFDKLRYVLGTENGKVDIRKVCMIQ